MDNDEIYKQYIEEGMEDVMSFAQYKATVEYIDGPKKTRRKDRGGDEG